MGYGRTLGSVISDRGGLLATSIVAIINDAVRTEARRNGRSMWGMG